ncbi:MAG: MATE family efflux transporter [Candidatus Izemoplasmataceae bacterium]
MNKSYIDKSYSQGATKDEKKSYLILKDPNIYKGLILLAFPLMINNFLRTFHDIIDMFFVSRIPDYTSEAVSSIQMTFPVVFTFISLAMGLSIAGTTLIGQFIGAKNIPMARYFASKLFLVASVSGLIFMVVALFFAPHVVGWMGAEGYVLENATEYLRIRSLELPLLFMFFAYMGTRQASGDTVSPVLISGSGIILNTILSPIFISVLGFGVAGAAWATFIGNGLVFPIAIYRLFKAKTGITVDPRSILGAKDEKALPFAVRFKTIIKIIKTAAPASFGQAFTAIGFGVMNGVIYSFGVETVAAFGIGNRLVSMVLHPVMAMGAILAAYIGQNIGANNPERAKETMKKTFKLSIGIMAVGALMLLPFRGYLAGFFLEGDPAAHALAMDFMLYILLSLPLMAVFQTFIGTFNGTANTHYTFILAVTRLWGFRIPLIVLFGYLFPERGSQVIWEVMVLSNILIAGVGYGLYRHGVDFKPKVDTKRKKRRKVKPALENA